MSITILDPQRTRPVRGVLFDMDGVILDTEKLYARFWREACRFYGFDMTWEQALSMRSLNHSAGSQLLIRYFGETASYPMIRGKRIELMNAYIAEHGVEAKPGIYELLNYLDAHGIPAVITTASPTDRVRDHLGSLGLYDRFRRICSVAEVAAGKPEPDIYLFGAKCLGLAPGDCLALEDSFTGMVSAQRAGCMNVIIPDLDQPGEALLSIAYAKADSLTDIIEILEAE